MIQETLSEEAFGNWTIKHQRWRMDETEQWWDIDAVVNSAGQYIGGLDDAKALRKRGIEPELAEPDHSTCSIGFCEAEQKWYGWSHRAVFGYGIGHFAEEGNCETTSGWIDAIDPRTGEKDAIPVPPGFEAKTLDDCKRLAVAFAASVS